jgi:hypothetical protein
LGYACSNARLRPTCMSRRPVFHLKHQQQVEQPGKRSSLWKRSRSKESRCAATAYQKTVSSILSLLFLSACSPIVTLYTNSPSISRISLLYVVYNPYCVCPTDLLFCHLFFLLIRVVISLPSLRVSFPLSSLRIIGDGGANLLRENTNNLSPCHFFSRGLTFSKAR